VAQGTQQGTQQGAPEGTRHGAPEGGPPTAPQGTSPGEDPGTASGADPGAAAGGTPPAEPDVREALSTHRPPNKRELAAWRAFLRAHAGLTRRLEEDLMREQQLPLAMYDVLVQLLEAGGRLRMTELAGAVLISRSGLTRLVDRMVTAGYVRREPSPGDARGVFAVLTDAGFERLKAASPTHLGGIGAYVVDRLDPEELMALGRACEKLATVEPVAAQHARTELATTEPAATEPAATEPAATDPTTTEPTATQPASG
jgi:DNA-binding MarR family transcriptional regulator